LRVQNLELQPILIVQIKQRKTSNSFSCDIVSVYITQSYGKVSSTKVNLFKCTALKLGG